MKRLVPFLILTLFCLGSFGGRVLHIHHYFQKRPSHHHGVHDSISFASDDVPDNPDEAEHSLALPVDLVLFPESCSQPLPVYDVDSLTPRSEDHHQGLGCGGLPA
jgi:hypothetical protein